MAKTSKVTVIVGDYEKTESYRCKHGNNVTIKRTGSAMATGIKQTVEVGGCVKCASESILEFMAGKR